MGVCEVHWDVTAKASLYLQNAINSNDTCIYLISVTREREMNDIHILHRTRSGLLTSLAARAEIKF